MTPRRDGDRRPEQRDLSTDAPPLKDDGLDTLVGAAVRKRRTEKPCELRVFASGKRQYQRHRMRARGRIGTAAIDARSRPQRAKLALRRNATTQTYGESQSDLAIPRLGDRVNVCDVRT